MIFWKHIKGYETQNSEGTYVAPLWSFFIFQPNNSSSGVVAEYNNVPVLKINNSNTKTGATDCGHLIVEKASGQKIDTAFTFNSTVTIKDNIYLDGGKYLGLNGTSADTRLIYTSNTLYMQSAGAIELSATNAWRASSGSHMVFSVPSESYQFQFTSAADSSNWAILVKGCFIMYDGYIKASSSYIQAGTYLKAGSYCEAQYFNATSDKRAKTDIQPLLIDALDLVRKTQLYSFKYKETDTPSIGIIAQDVQDININGFKLVDNEEATGKDLDYMTIHESKLTYILWKAVQEQQKMIDDLQRQLAELKKN